MGGWVWLRAGVGRGQPLNEIVTEEQSLKAGQLVHLVLGGGGGG